MNGPKLLWQRWLATQRTRRLLRAPRNDAIPAKQMTTRSQRRRLEWICTKQTLERTTGGSTRSSRTTRTKLRRVRDEHHPFSLERRHESVHVCHGSSAAAAAAAPSSLVAFQHSLLLSRHWLEERSHCVFDRLGRSHNQTQQKQETKNWVRGTTLAKVTINHLTHAGRTHGEKLVVTSKEEEHSMHLVR